jgi:hypothetical protein
MTIKNKLNNTKQLVLNFVIDCFKSVFFPQLGKHPQGTEVKAITYSAMQINERENFAEVFLIIDI